MSYQVIHEYLMRGDGVQSPGALIIRHFPGHHRPYQVHFHNHRDGGFHHGDYCETLHEAEKFFQDRIKRYDPTGILNKSLRL